MMHWQRWLPALIEDTLHCPTFLVSESWGLREVLSTSKTELTINRSCEFILHRSSSLTVVEGVKKILPTNLGHALRHS